MPENREKRNLPPDLYSRNTVITSIADKLAEKPQFSVLDVGGNGGKLHWFMERANKFVVLDLKAKPKDEDDVEYRQADARKLPFSDRNFDFVVSSDMLEHVNPGDYPKILDEMLRVSKKYLIIGAPFQTPLTVKAEEQIRSQFFANAGVEHPFLIEHETNGLPDEQSFEKLLTKRGVNFMKIKEGNLMNWYIQQLYSGAQVGEMDNFDKYGFYTFFNEHLFELGNLRAPTYRTLFVIAKEGLLPEEEIKSELTTAHTWNSETFMQLLRIAFDDLRFLLNRKKAWLKQELQEAENEKGKVVAEREEIRAKARKAIDIYRKTILEVRDFLQEKERALEFMKAILKDKDASLEALGKEKENIIAEIGKQESFVKVLNQQLDEKNLEIESMKAHIIEQEEALKMTQSLLSQKQAESDNLKIDLENHRAELTKIRNSRAWRLIMVYGRIKGFLILNPVKAVMHGWKIWRALGTKIFIERLIRKLKKNPVTSSAYQRFIDENIVTPAKIKQMKKQTGEFEYRPVISIVMPVYNIEEKWLVKAIESVKSQVYDRWELCIADDASTAAHIRPLLDKYSRQDKRIKVMYRRQNGGIVKASNDALALAQGAYVGLMDNDDELAPEALFEVVKTLQEKRYDLVYSDEDKMELNGARCEAFFKPDWSPDLLLSCNYVSHFGVYRRKILLEIGGFRDGFDGSQDYDLVLRFTEKSQEVRHIPKILYHWRKIAGSTAASTEAKPYAYVSAKKALSEALKRRGVDAEVSDGSWKGSYRVTRKIATQPLISIIIPFKDKKDILQACVESILNKTTYPNYELILVDNASAMFETKEYLRQLEENEKIKILSYDKPFNYSSINNFAVKHAKGEVLVLLNNDTEVITHNWLEAMLEHAQRPEVGAVGAKLLYPDNTIQHAGVLIGLGGLAGHAFSRQSTLDPGYFGLVEVVRNYSAVTAACIMVRKSVYEEVGGLDEKNLAVAFNDVDFCLKMRAKGYLILYTPYACLYHYESLSRGFEVNLKEVQFMQQKYATLLKAGDPYYNPNLTRERPDFSLRCVDKVTA